MNYLGVFAKYWQPGRVKTRLAESIGSENASKLYQHFLTHVVTRCSTINACRSLWYWPQDSLGEFKDFFARIQLDTRQWTLRPQTAGDLGQRMIHFFDQTFREARSQSVNEANVVLIGSDAPHLPSRIYESAFAVLESSDVDVVIGPSEDGGYYLIGMRNETFPIFDAMPWSTDRLLDMTLDIIRQQNISYQLLPTYRDIDDLNDLEQVRQSLVEKSNADFLDRQLLLEFDRALRSTKIGDE